MHGIQLTREPSGSGACLVPVAYASQVGPVPLACGKEGLMSHSGGT